MAYYNYQQPVTYPQLIIKQIEIIQSICSKELNDGEKVTKNLIGEQTIHGEDTRHSFLQSVELLGSLLSPWFPKEDEKTENITSQFNYFCEVYDMELSEALQDEDFKKLVCDSFNIKDTNKIITQIKDNKLDTEINAFFLNIKIKEGRKIFRSLVKLFKDHDFLKEESFGDSGEDNGMTANDDEDESDIDGEFVE